MEFSSPPTLCEAVSAPVHQVQECIRAQSACTPQLQHTAMKPRKRKDDRDCTKNNTQKITHAEILELKGLRGSPQSLPWSSQTRSDTGRAFQALPPAAEVVCLDEPHHCLSRSSSEFAGAMGDDLMAHGSWLRAAGREAGQEGG